MLNTLWRRKWLVIVPALVAAITAVMVVHLVPVRYQSESTLVLVPAQIPADYVHQLVNPSTAQLSRLTAIGLSRTRLERLITQYDLYREDRGRMPMEDVVQRMRDDIEFNTSEANVDGMRSLKVSYRSPDPRVAQRIAENLAGFVINQSEADRASLSEGTTQFLDSVIADAKHHLEQFESSHRLTGRSESRTTAIEREVLEDSYRSLLMKRQEARIAANLEVRQYGDKFRLLDSPRIPERPIGLTRTQLTWAGALSGLALGFVVVGVSSLRRRSGPDA